MLLTGKVVSQKSNDKMKHDSIKKLLLKYIDSFFRDCNIIHRQVTKLVNHETFLAQNLNADDLIKFTNDKIC